MALIPIFVPVIFSQPVREAYLQIVNRQIAKIAPPEFVFIGDSLTANGNWRWLLSRNQFSAAENRPTSFDE